MPEPTDLMAAEIWEQPAAAVRLLAAEEAKEAAALLAERHSRLIRFVAHGSSDNAAVYGSYVFTTMLGLPTMRASLSSLLAYQSKEQFGDNTVIALSQSGKTPDVVAYARRARDRGAFVVALTNDPESPLSEAADYTVPLLAGREHAIPATKTYLNSVLALALIASVHGDQVLAEHMRTVPELLAQELRRQAAPVERLAESLSDCPRVITVGRGYELATAREVALKLKEAAGLAAEPIGALEALHGPLAELAPSAAVLAFCSRGPLVEEVSSVCAAAARYGARVIGIGNAADRIAADVALEVAEAPEVLAPLLSVLPGQLLAARLGKLRNANTAQPPGLSKVVTERPQYLDDGCTDEAIA